MIKAVTLLLLWNRMLTISQKQCSSPINPTEKDVLHVCQCNKECRITTNGCMQDGSNVCGQIRVQVDVDEAQKEVVLQFSGKAEQEIVIPPLDNTSMSIEVFKMSGNATEDINAKTKDDGWLLAGHDRIKKITIENIKFPHFLHKHEFPPSLKHLSVVNSGLEYVPAISSNANLSDVILSGNPLKIFPASLLKITKLQNLIIHQTRASKMRLTEEDVQAIREFHTHGKRVELRHIQCEKKLENATEYCSNPSDEEEATSTSSEEISTSMPIIISVLIFILLLILLICYFQRKRHQPRNDESLGIIPEALDSRLLVGSCYDDLKHDIESTHSSTDTSQAIQDVRISVVPEATIVENIIPKAVAHLPETHIPQDQLQMNKSTRVAGRENVVVAKLRDNPVYVRRILDKSESEACAAELKCFSSIQHENISQFLGISWNNDLELLLVAEYVDPSRSLATLLSENRLSWQEKLEIAIGIADGMTYLDTRFPSIDYSPLAASRIYMDDENKPQLDFMQCNLITSELNEPSHQIFSFGFNLIPTCAPEVLRHDRSNPHTASVYAFGVILCQVTRNGANPFGIADVDEIGSTFAELTLMEDILSGVATPSPSPDCPDAFAKLIAECVHLRPLDRPKWSWILETLGSECPSVEM